MIGMYRKLLDLLQGRERKQFYLLVVMILVMGVFDMAGVAAILPFLRVVTDPTVIQQNELLSRLHDWADPASTQSFLILLGTLVLGIVVIGLTVKITTMYAISRFTHMRKFHLSTRLLSGYLRQPYVWFLDRHSAEIGQTVLVEVDHVVGAALVPAMQILAQATTVVFLLALLIMVEPGVALISAVVLGGLYAVIFLFVRQRLLRLGQVRLRANTERFKLINETTGGIKDVKLAGLEKSYVARFSIPARLHAKTLVSEQIVREIPRYALEAIAFGGMVVLILVLLVQRGGNVSELVPVLGLFALAGLRILPAIQQVYHSLSSMRVGLAGLDRVWNDLTMLQQNDAAPLANAAASGVLQLHDRLELDSVNYRYPQVERAAVEDLTMTVSANTTVGIVGGTGAGKTTAVDLILGLLTADAGEIRIDGTPIGPGNMRAWQNNVGYVPQHIFLVDDTIAANIAFGVPPEARDGAAIERASRLAELHDFVIDELPEGYETRVGERGVRLSGGQRQRIGIARALYHDPDVLILDEATSALDNLTERAVMDAVRNLGHAKTIIMIAHRLSTVRACDTIFLMEHGRVAASGSYDELVATNPTFREMALIAS